jgi:DNA-binding NtrC family response regulator
VEIDFFPLHGAKGLLGILGKITAQPAILPILALPVPDKLHALREAHLQRYRFELHPGETPATRRVGEQAHLAAQTRSSVLIVGEAGAGKRWLARTIHCQGTARDRTFVALDCAGLPPAALTAALFGPEGLARRSSVGTVFLARVETLPREVQQQVATWLGEPSVERPRVIASVVGEPAEEVQAGRLLQELHCALATLRIDVPALRDRATELPLFVQSILDRANAERSRRVQGLGAEAWDAVRAYPWPGNIRELDAVLADAHVRAAGERIELADLPAYVRRSVQMEQVAGRTPPRSLPLKALLEQVERRLIEMALRMAKGKKGRAARILAIWRPLLLRRMEKLGIKDE